MEQDYIKNDLLLMIYGECDIFKRLELEHALIEEAYLSVEMDSIMESIQSLPTLRYSPKKKTVENILLHAGS